MSELRTEIMAIIKDDSITDERKVEEIYQVALDAFMSGLVIHPGPGTRR